MPTTRRRKSPRAGVMEEETKPSGARRRSNPNAGGDRNAAVSAEKTASAPARKGESVFEGFMQLVGGEGSEPTEGMVRFQWLLGKSNSRRRFALRVVKYVFWTYIIWFPILTHLKAENYSWALCVLGGTVLWLGAFVREQPETVAVETSATKGEEKVRLHWLLGNADSRRRFGVRVFKYLTVMYFTLMALLTLWSAQRGGWLFQGRSFYLPNHSPGQMRKTAMAFRNMFFTVATSHGFSRASIERMILFPNDKIFTLSPLAYDATARPDLSDPADESDAKAGMDLAMRVLRKIDRVFAAVKPSSLFEIGETQPFVKVKGGSRALFDRTGPITLIVFPGVVSEMIETAVFSELQLWGSSSLAAEWRSRLNECAAIPPASPESDADHESCDQTDTVDRRFSLDDLEIISQPLSDLVSLASIDAPPGCTAEEGAEESCPTHGKRLVNLVRMNAIMGSLETVGSLERTSSLYIRRLSKVFTVMGDALTNCYIVGYSRGAAVALDTLVRASGSNKANGKAGMPGGSGGAKWVDKIRGIVSLAGVLFGTEAADTILDKQHLHGRLMESITNAIDLMDYSHEGDMGTVAHAKEVASNTQIFLQMGMDLAGILAEKEVAKPMAKEFSRLGAPTPDFAVIGNMLNKFLLNTFHLSKPVSSYYDNVRKFKIVIDKVFSGLTELTTTERLRWWQTNTLPARPLSYYAITATMPDSAPLKLKAEQESSGSKLEFDPDSADAMAMRALYYDMLNVTSHLPGGGKQLNDGNVAADRAMFWPTLARLLNPKQVNFRGVYLGILNGHHWNIAMPSVFDSTSDPFPRKVLVEALAAFLAQEQIANGG